MGNALTITKNVTVGESYDVIVVGGCPSGSAAAIAAGRAGSKVLLIEQENCLGGMWTSGLLSPLFDAHNKTGIMKELVDDLTAKNAWGGFWQISYIQEYMKHFLEEKALSAGVTLLYETKYAGVKGENGTVEGIYVRNVEGETYYKGTIIIDATGDAHLAADAGAQWVMGDENGNCQSMTLMFLVGGIPEKYKDGFVMYQVLENAYEKQGLGKHSPFKMPYMIPIPNSDYATVQLTHMDGSVALDAKRRTLAVIEGRRQMIDVFEALKGFDEDFKNLCLIASAAQLGVRESRRVIGDYYITEEDLLNGTQFPDGVCTATFNVDIHVPNSTEQHNQSVMPYQIPYRAMLPKGLHNVLVAGRCISGSHIAMASYRVTGNCCAMGEAAGKAAAYAVQNNVSLREVPNRIVVPMD